MAGTNVRPTTLVARFLLAAIGLGCAGVGAAQEYQVIDLGDFKPGKRIISVGDGGFVLAGNVNGDSGPRPLLYSVKNGQAIWLPTPPRCQFALASSVNKKGEAVGCNENNAVLWRANGAIADLGGREAFAMDLNDQGAIAGYKVLPGGYGGYSTPVVWNADGGMIAIAPPQGGFGRAEAINNKGEVAGYEFQIVNGTHTSERPFKWSRTAGIVWLAVPDGADTSVAQAINDDGYAVGFASSTIPSLDAQAMLWDPDGTPHALARGLGWICQASAINNHNAIVGETPTKSGTDGWMWTKENGLVKLSTLVKAPRWTFSSPSAIDDDGNIAGIGEYAGHMHGFMLVVVKPTALGPAGK